MTDNVRGSHFRQDGLTVSHLEELLRKGLTTGHIAEALGSVPAPAQGQGGGAPAASTPAAPAASTPAPASQQK